MRKQDELNPVPRVIKPAGVIEKSLELIAKQKSKDYILEVDGKKVVMGLDDKFDDIDLWGYESPNLNDQQLN